jgi:hypothetical protein
MHNLKARETAAQQWSRDCEPVLLSPYTYPIFPTLSTVNMHSFVIDVCNTFKEKGGVDKFLEVRFIRFFLGAAWPYENQDHRADLGVTCLPSHASKQELSNRYHPFYTSQGKNPIRWCPLFPALITNWQLSRSERPGALDPKSFTK